MNAELKERFEAVVNALGGVRLFGRGSATQEASAYIDDLADWVRKVADLNWDEVTYEDLRTDMAKTEYHLEYAVEVENNDKLRSLVEAVVEFETLREQLQIDGFSTTSKSQPQERMPAWVPSLLHPVLPGGEEWEADREAGHPILATRLHRLAVDPLISSGEWDGDDLHEVKFVRLRHGSAFEGYLEFELQGRPPSVSNPDDFVWIGLWTGPSRDRAETWELPVVDKVRFYRFVHALNREMGALV